MPARLTGRPAPAAPAAAQRPRPPAATAADVKKFVNAHFDEVIAGLPRMSLEKSELKRDAASTFKAYAKESGRGSPPVAYLASMEGKDVAVVGFENWKGGALAFFDPNGRALASGRFDTSGKFTWD